MEQTSSQAASNDNTHELVPPARRPGVPRIMTAESAQQNNSFKVLGILTLVVFTFVALYFLLTGPLATMTRASVSETPSQSQSMIFAHPLSMKADGVTKSKVDVFVASEDGKPIPNKVVDITATVGTPEPSSLSTDEEGHAVFYLTMSEAGLASISFSVDKIPFSQTVSVRGE